MPIADSAAIRRILLSLLCIDGALILLNLLGPPSFLNLDEEKNFTTWYSSAKLLAAGLAALVCAGREPASGGRRCRLGWGSLAALLALLSMDETATAHERLAAWLLDGGFGSGLRDRFAGGDAAKDAFLWPLLFSPLIVASLYFLIVFLGGRLGHDRRLTAMAGTGVALFALAVVLEGPAVYSSPPVAAWGTLELGRYRLYSIAEESAETIGATLLLAALLLHAARDRPAD